MANPNPKPIPPDKRGKRGPSKVGLAAKEVIQMASERLGGPDRLVAWAKEDPLNERAFWSNVYPKLLPLQLTGDVGLTIKWPVATPSIER